MAGSKAEGRRPAAVPDVVPHATHLVAIGASAGGLDALERFFASLPPEPGGAAYVVVQHLSPDHKSMMTSLLARHTSLPIVTVEDGMPLAPDRVHLIPPGMLMRCEGGVLRLTPKAPRAFTLPIDVFFESAATDFRENVVGIVLSGTGSDGTRGAGAINEAGGLLLAQSPAEAKFDGMPRSVIETGLVDAVLPVAEMPARIVSHLRSEPPSALMDHEAPHGEAGWTDNVSDVLGGILHTLRQLGGINFEDYKPATVLRRLERRMAVRQVPHARAYLALLQDDPAEAAVLRRELLIPVTRFFRDEDAFEQLRTDVIEPLVASRPADQPLRVWCAGVSTGEEAYSVAMLFLKAFERHQRWPNLKVFATDVEQHNIDFAGVGRYADSAATEVPGDDLERFFERRGEGYTVRPELRQCIVFARHNLLTDPPFTRIDLVVCRNVLIYFKSPAQERVLRRLHYALAHHGRLFLGPSESLGPLEADFECLNAKRKLWRARKTGAPVTDLLGNAPALRGAARPGTGRGNGHAAAAPASFVDQSRAALSQAYAPPPAVLVNARLELLHSFGDVSAYVRVPPGLATLELPRMLLPALQHTASALLFKAVREAVPVTSAVLGLSGDLSHATAPADTPAPRVRLKAHPAGEWEGQRLTLLAFEAVEPAAGLPAAADLLDVGAETNERLNALERELSATRESLQAAIEELETSNEELQATNEELMSSNEELQSSNEELQSVNEELNTVNAEYQEKIDVLNRLNADLDSLARVVAAGTVFVDDTLCVTRFSPEAAELFRFRSADIGRPIEDLNHALVFPDFIAMLQASLDTERVQERDVSSRLGRRYLVRMLPYRVASSGRRGVVVSFLDITSVHEATQLQAILDALVQHVAVIDERGVIRTVNRAWLRFAEANGDPGAAHCGPGSHYLRSCAVEGQADGGYAEQAVDGLRAVLEGRAEAFSLEYPCNSPTEARWFVMHVQPLRAPGDEGGGPRRPVSGAVVSHFDVTSWRQPRASQQP